MPALGLRVVPCNLTLIHLVHFVTCYIITITFRVKNVSPFPVIQRSQ